MTCTFFGHRNMPKEIEPILKSTLTDLIENHGVTLFYVVTYVTNYIGSGAAQFMKLAERYGKVVMNIV